MKSLFFRLCFILLLLSLLALPACSEPAPSSADDHTKYDPIIASYEFTLTSGNQTITPTLFYSWSMGAETEKYPISYIADGLGYQALYYDRKDEADSLPELKLEEEILLSHDSNFTVDEKIVLFDITDSQSSPTYIPSEELSLLDDGYYYVAFMSTVEIDGYKQGNHHVFKLIVGESAS